MLHSASAMNEFYTDYSEYMKRYFPDFKVQKISINTGADCPNRDGTIGHGGCIYCNNTSFTPSYCFEKEGIAAQIAAGKSFFSKKYPDMRFLAYFQSFTNTYRKSVKELEEDYREALRQEDVAGLIIGTRPDCLPPETVDMLARLNKEYPVFVELGVESMHDATLKIINRGHDSECSRSAIIRLADAGLHVGVHLIAGLPGETEEMTLDTIRRICTLPVESIKLHHLQVLRDTPLYHKIKDKEISLHAFGPEEYIGFCIKAIKIIPRSVAIERFLASSPPQLVVSPRWGLKNYEFTNLLLNKLRNQ